ncbi:hypothetical protein M405DRAFT_506564 [Rhizopogon salebrosus TDB-379]|nr:hypothetical protein M405DRAFT_506564 [Rhizopogon salebrosus TDB-379]
MQVSSSGSTVGKLRASACTRNRTHSYPPVTLAYDAGHGDTRRFPLLSPASAGSLNSSPTLPDTYSASSRRQRTFPRTDIACTEDIIPSHEHPLSFSNLPSLSYDDIPIRQLNARNIHTKNEEFQEALVLFSHQHPPATSSTAHKCTLKSLGIGIEED